MSLFHDLIFALRTFRKNPRFTLTAVCAPGLGRGRFEPRHFKTFVGAPKLLPEGELHFDAP